MGSENSNLEDKGKRVVTQREYLEWMALRPRLNDWSAFVAYKRDKCNQLLMQEYIESFDKDSYLPLINEPYLSGDNEWRWKLNYEMDAPRLSFENKSTDNNDNDAEVNMSMAVLGGIDIHLNDTYGTEVTLIASYDPLDHEALEAERVPLMDVTGAVGEDGAVGLNLASAQSQRYIWELKGPRIEHQRRVAGAFFKRKFREAGQARSSFKLGQVAPTDQAFLNPSKFRLRTVMPTGAGTVGSPNYGDGALEIRIAMKDELVGGTPGEDWLYPIPSDLPGVDASLMLSNKMLMEKIIRKGVVQAFNAENMYMTSSTDGRGFITGLKASPPMGGAPQTFYMNIPTTVHGTESEGFLVLTDVLFAINFDMDSALTISTTADRRISLKLGSRQSTQAISGLIRPPNEREFYQIRGGRMALEVIGEYVFGIDPEQGKITVEMDLPSISVSLYSSDSVSQDFIRKFEGDLTFIASLRKSVHEALVKIFSTLDDIDAFVLHSLLFNSTDAVQLKTVDAPGDLVSFGAISPRLTTFSINNKNPMVGHGGAITFTTTPANFEGLTWSVHNLDGTTQGAGTIDANGRYTAPALDQIGGTYKRVKVTAQGPAGSDGKRPVSKALVTVAAKAITLNPLVQTCKATKAGEGDESRQFSAGSLQGSLTWTVIGDGRQLQAAPTPISHPRSKT
ncbi:hypothetical protein NYP20_16630 [Pseudomonas sp. N3-W]|uniref:hypothetical protein n=1 Tax=Pseudomonas sp. N3-W TaxID=2975049 RepID=UPI00217E2CD5|nr:hypothetical protein [Pseudomonas sp. N3-W]UWF46975.1 hypothetical protein NYP20_16630 [Pseudomonas sp. N3-W]